ncbi:MAG: hypothetical protein U0263_03800 [Polyangiaceae bacterium]
MPRRACWMSCALALTACPKHEPAAVEPRSVATASTPAPSAEPAEGTTPAPPSSAGEAPSAAPPAISEPSSIGDTTCASDTDCAITTRADCCECCASQPMATSGAWLDWREGQCKKTRCEPCGKVKCRWFEPASAFRARCVERSCVLERQP